MTAAAPRPVTTNQAGISPRLATLTARRARQRYARPIAGHSRQVFDRLGDWLPRDAVRLILDSGCGSGAATLALAAAHPDAHVIGIDKSAHRLARRGLTDGVALHGNAALVRADLVDFWRLAAAAGWTLERHYLLYPNPWPKHHQLARRWHAHPVFPALLALGGRLEVRSNWRLYLAEFAAAAAQHGLPGARIRQWRPAAPLTPFERKYALAGQPLYRLELDLTPTAAAAGCCTAS